MSHNKSFIIIIIIIDYCNSLLSNVPAVLVSKFQRLQNRAARIILQPRGGRNVIIHSSPLLQELSWLPVQARIRFKTCCTVHKCLNSLAPAYLSDLLVLYSRPERLHQARENTLRVPQTSRKIGLSAFEVSGPTQWNKLPIALKTQSDHLSFRKQLKTYLWNN